MKPSAPKIEKAALEDESDITVDSYIEDIVDGKRVVFFLPGAVVFAISILLPIFAGVALGGGIISWIRYLLTVPQQAFAEFIVILIVMFFVYGSSFKVMSGKKQFVVVMEYYTKTALFISLTLLVIFGFVYHELNPMFLGGAIINAIILRLIYTPSYFVYTELSYRLHKRRREVA
ncbi:hypothetical protein MNBD_GAMMA12-1931, partial [hydrothermal vent metagenome]